MGPLKKPNCALALAAGGRPLKMDCDVLGVARSVAAVKQARSSDWQDGRCAKPTDDMELGEGIKTHVAHLPTYGYRRIWALLRRSREMVGGDRASTTSACIGSCMSTSCCGVGPACDGTSDGTTVAWRWTRAMPAAESST